MKAVSCPGCRFTHPLAPGYKSSPTAHVNGPHITCPPVVAYSKLDQALNLEEYLNTLEGPRPPSQPGIRLRFANTEAGTEP